MQIRVCKRFFFERKNKSSLYVIECYLFLFELTAWIKKKTVERTNRITICMGKFLYQSRNSSSFINDTTQGWLIFNGIIFGFKFIDESYNCVQQNILTNKIKISIKTTGCQLRFCLWRQGRRNYVDVTNEQKVWKNH